MWFLSTEEPVRWCAFVDKAKAREAADQDHFAGQEAAELIHDGSTVERVLVQTQSEDAYVEDTYRIGPDRRVTKLVRRGHYVTDPFTTATYLPDREGKLRLTAASRTALKRSKYTAYFLDWPVYERFGQMPFASLIRLKSRIAASTACSVKR